MRPTYMVGNVATPEPRLVVPPPKGIHDFSTPLPKGAMFTHAGVRQWNSHAFAGGNLPVPEGGKCSYNPSKQVLDEQADDRVNEFLGRYASINEEARNVLQQRFAQKNAVRDLEQYQQLINRGLTDAEAGEVIRRKLIEKVSSSKGQERIDFHQKQKDIIADLAITRRVKVGLPQSMANFAGVSTPEMNYSGSEIAGMKRLLQSKIGEVDLKRKNESMIGQNFNSFPKATDAGWTRNVPSIYRDGGIITGVVPPGGSPPVVFDRTSISGTLDEILRRHGGALPPPPPPRRDDRTAEEVFSGRSGRPHGEELRPEYNLGYGRTPLEFEAPSRAERLEEVVSSSSSSTGLRPAENVAGEGPGGAVGGAGGRGRGRPVNTERTTNIDAFESGLRASSNESRYVRTVAIRMGIDPDSPEFKKPGGRYTDIPALTAKIRDVLREE
jgi:hypothetical protein